MNRRGEERLHLHLPELGDGLFFSTDVSSLDFSSENEVVFVQDYARLTRLHQEEYHKHKVEDGQSGKDDGSNTHSYPDETTQVSVCHGWYEHAHHDSRSDYVGNSAHELQTESPAYDSENAADDGENGSRDDQKPAHSEEHSESLDACARIAIGGVE